MHSKLALLPCAAEPNCACKVLTQILRLCPYTKSRVQRYFDTANHHRSSALPRFHSNAVDAAAAEKCSGQACPTTPLSRAGLTASSATSFSPTLTVQGHASRACLSPSATPLPPRDQSRCRSSSGEEGRNVARGVQLSSPTITAN